MKTRNKTIIGDATFYLGDCLDIMAGLPENSIDTIITDPPYGLRFMGKKWDYDVPSVEIWKECLRILKPGGTALIFAGSRTQHRMAINVEDAGFILKDCIMWIYGSGFPKATDISKQIDKRARAKRKTKGNNPAYRKNHKKENSWRQGEGRESTPLGAEHLTVPTTPKAQFWDGWKSHGLKPAYEPILVAMKPNDGSYAENALKHGISGLNIDGGRIEGRYPANIILDEEAGKMLDDQSGELISGSRTTECSRESENTCMSGKNYKRELPVLSGSFGGASRFFYCAKASPAERNAGCESLPLNDPTYGKNMSSSDKGTISGSVNPTRNNHPTVKPISLMEYLCNLTRTPTGGIVIDPFMGSGTTAIACHHTGREFIGIEKEEKYFEIAIARYRNEIQQMRLCDLKVNE